MNREQFHKMNLTDVERGLARVSKTLESLRYKRGGDFERQREESIAAQREHLFEIETRVACVLAKAIKREDAVTSIRETWTKKDKTLFSEPEHYICVRLTDPAGNTHEKTITLWIEEARDSAYSTYSGGWFLHIKGRVNPGNGKMKEHRKYKIAGDSGNVLANGKAVAFAKELAQRYATDAHYEHLAERSRQQKKDAALALQAVGVFDALQNDFSKPEGLRRASVNVVNASRLEVTAEFVFSSGESYLKFARLLKDNGYAI